MNTIRNGCLIFTGLFIITGCGNDILRKQIEIMKSEKILELSGYNK
jgi:hypothetical protein